MMQKKEYILCSHLQYHGAISEKIDTLKESSISLSHACKAWQVKETEVRMEVHNFGEVPNVIIISKIGFVSLNMFN